MLEEVNQKRLAELLGLSTRQIRNLEQKGVPHRAEGNAKLYPIPEAVQWYNEWTFERGKEEATPTNYQEALARKTDAEASLKELDLAQKRGELIRVDQHVDVLSTVLERLRARLLSYPDVLAPQLVAMETPRQARGVLMPAMRQVLEELSSDPDSLLDEDAGEAQMLTPLPDGMPGRAALVAAGIESLEALLVLEDYTSIARIGKVTARKIRAFLEELE